LEDWSDESGRELNESRNFGLEHAVKKMERISCESLRGSSREWINSLVVVLVFLSGEFEILFIFE
jgi:hypothetical protein